ncbi:MAG: hypothetical protein M1839_002582 [Geoglossum umbratile]|nr:MAG: hypothetical protein M1839_002582 [Geoglossum umbratile]
MVSATILSVYCCCLCGWIITYKLRFSPLAKIPGPWWTAFTGLELKYNEFTGSRRVFVQNLHQRYGAVVRLAPNEVSFATHNAVKEIYASGGSGYDKTEFYSAFERFGIRNLFSMLSKDEVSMGLSGVLGASADSCTKHSKRRRCLVDLYANKNVLQPAVIGAIRERARTFVSNCTRRAGTGVDVYVYLHCYALDCITHLLFHPFGTHSIEDPEDLKMVRELSYYSSLKARLLKYYSPFLSAALGGLFSPERVKHDSIVDQYTRRTCMSNPAEYTVLYRLRSQKEELQELEIASECSDHLSAGIDTTGDALCFLMWRLSQPDCFVIQDQLREELATNPDTTSDNLQYLDAVVKEGLRCFPPIPMSLPRYVPYGGRSLEGYHLPAGTIVSCQAFTLHQIDTAVFPEPKSFIPERWLEKEGSLERNKLFFAFAAGGRGCIGKKYAFLPGSGS